MKNAKSIDYGYRFPAEIISHAVWLYHRFCLSYRDVEDLLAERGIKVSYETIQYENNRAELSPEPTRQRERQMRRFKSAGQAQRLLAVHRVVGKLFRRGRHLIRAAHYRESRSRAFCEWQQVTYAG